MRPFGVRRRRRRDPRASTHRAGAPHLSHQPPHGAARHPQALAPICRHTPSPPTETDARRHARGPSGPHAHVPRENIYSVVPWAHSQRINVGPTLLSPIHTWSAQTRIDLTLIRALEVAVQTRTKIVNAVRGMVKSTGHRLPASLRLTFARKATEACPKALQPALLPLL